MKTSALRLSFLSGLALTMATTLASAGRTTPVAGAQTGRATINRATITGTTFKHNVTSEMRFQLNINGADEDGVAAGYGLFGDTLVDRLNSSGEQVQIHLANLNFSKYGSMDLSQDARKLEAERAQGDNSKILTKEYDTYGSIELSGRKIGPRKVRDLENPSATEIVIAGTKLSGSFRNENAGAGMRSGNAINFSGLMVNGQPSSGRMNYSYYIMDSGSGGYHSENLRFGPYAISNSMGTRNDVDNPFMSYSKSSNSMKINMIFGDLEVTGTIQYSDKTDTQLRTYTVQVQDPYTSMMISQQRMKLQNRQINRMFSNRRSSLGDIMVNNMMDQAHSQMLDNMERATTRTEVRQQAITSIVATEGQYSLTIKPRGGRMLAVSKNVADATEIETQMKALLAFLVSINYDISSE